MFGSSVGENLEKFDSSTSENYCMKLELNEYLWCLGMKSGDYKPRMAIQLN